MNNNYLSIQKEPLPRLEACQTPPKSNNITWTGFDASDSLSQNKRDKHESVGLRISDDLLYRETKIAHRPLASFL
jgi:hypothetical protein